MIRPRRRRLLVASLLLAAALAQPGCGASKHGGAASAPAPHERGLLRAPAASAGPGRGAGAAPRPEVDRALVAEVDARCAAVAGAPVAVDGAAEPRRHAAELLSERAQLVALDRALRGVRVPPADRPQMSRYVHALRQQIALDAIVAHGLRASGAVDDGVRMGVYQNGYNRRARSRLARALGLSPCLRDHGQE